MQNGFMRGLLAGLLLIVVGCSTAPTDSSLSTDSGAGTSDDFATFGGSDSAADVAAAPESGAPAEANPEAGIEKELAAQQSAMNQDIQPVPSASEPAPAAPAEKDDFADFDSPAPAPAESAPAPEVPPAVDQGQTPAPQVAVEDPFTAPAAPEPPAESPVAETAPPPEAPAPETPVAEAPARPSGSDLITINNIQYRANDNGGTIVIEANGPMTFEQRMNQETHQMVVEIQNARLPRRLKRPFNTRDFGGTIGSIDAYQGRNSTTARIVVQLREGAPEPVIQAEGSQLFVVAQPPQAEPKDQNETADEASTAEPLPSKLMASENLEEFLGSNQSYYGKKISIETDEAEIRDVIRLISEESNVNLIISDDVKGKLSLKLKNVPWDQALVMIMKTKKLGYTRAGNVLRIAPIADIRGEEDEAMKMSAARKLSAPLKVRNILVNYAPTGDLEKQIKPLLSPRGSVVSDPRTSTIVISDLDENIERAEKIVRSLDVPPQQVLIEGKVVEASDEFQRTVGINWGGSGRPYQLSNFAASAGKIRATNNFNVTPSLPSASTFGINFTLGTLDILGDLTAALRLFEQQSLVKVISSPRVLTLHNEPAEINQTQELPLITATIAANGVPQPQVSFKSVRLRLAVTPQVTNDGAVILGVDVNRETAGAVVDQASQAFPINARSAKTKIIVKNSQTAVIGGIYQNDQTDSDQRVPGIASVPILGWLFKNKDVKKRRNELLIFITPRILGRLEGAPTASGQLPPAPTESKAADGDGELQL